MKFKTTLILLIAFAVLLAAFLIFDKAPKPGEVKPEDKLVQVASADVQKLQLKRGPETLTFQKDDKGEWTIVEPLAAKADAFEVNGLADAFADLRIERVVEKEKADLAKYEIPKTEVALWVKGQEAPIRVLIGMENPIDSTFFAQKEGDPRVVLLGSLLKTPLEKKLFDFRQKDVFRFEIKDVGGIKVQAKDALWEAAKKGEDWFLSFPLKARARTSKIQTFLDTLANMRATEFAAEEKTADGIKKLGLDKPGTKITLTMPAAGKEIVFSLGQAEDKTYATTSESTKVIIPEPSVATELEKKPEDLREGKVAPFNTWQAFKVALKKGTIDLTITKGQNDKWYFDAAQKEEADALKVDTFIRKIESLEATEYVDNPKSLAEYGLAAPQATVTVWTKDTGEKPVEMSFTVLAGKVDAEKKQAVVKNAALDYLFKVDSAFLDEFPKDKKDWAPPAPAPEIKDEKK